MRKGVEGSDEEDLQADEKSFENLRKTQGEGREGESIEEEGRKEARKMRGRCTGIEEGKG